MPIKSNEPIIEKNTIYKNFNSKNVQSSLQNLQNTTIYEGSNINEDSELISSNLISQTEENNINKESETLETVSLGKKTLTNIYCFCNPSSKDANFIGCDNANKCKSYINKLLVS